MTKNANDTVHAIETTTRGQGADVANDVRRGVRAHLLAVPGAVDHEPRGPARAAVLRVLVQAPRPASQMLGKDRSRHNVS